MSTQTEMIDRQIREVMALKAEASYEKIREYIVPYLFEGNLFETSREEYRMEMAQFFNEEELDALVDEERPDVYVTTWREYKVTFLLDWSLKYDALSSSDFLPRSIAIPDGDAEKVLQQAIRNLRSINFRLNPIYLRPSGMEDMNIFSIGYGRGSLPDYSDSILLDRDTLGKIRELAGNDYAILPYHRDAVYVIPESDYQRYGSKSFKKVVQEVTDEFHQKFSDRVFIYHDGRLIEG